VVEKSKKIVAGRKKPAEKTAGCGEGHFQPLVKTFTSNNLRTTQTAQVDRGPLVQSALAGDN
jgi:hypothetical protein